MNNDVAIVEFKRTKKNLSVDIEIPLSMTANEFVVALNMAYDLNIDTNDVKKCYLKAERPIALIRGNKALYELGIRNGTVIIFTE